MPATISAFGVVSKACFGGCYLRLNLYVAFAQLGKALVEAVDMQDAGAFLTVRVSWKVRRRVSVKG